MKVCIITPTLFPEPGGPSIFVDRFVASLGKEGHQTSIIAVGESDDSIKGESYRVVKIRRGFPPLRILRTIFNILKLGWESDLLFSCGLFFESGISKLLIRKPLVIRVGGDPVWEKWVNQEKGDSNLVEFQKNRYSLRVELKKYLQRLSCQRADRVITPSHFFESIVKAWGLKDEKVVVIYNGIDLEKVKLATREKLKEQFNLIGKKVILTIGRLIRLKRVDQIIQSFAEMENDRCLLLIIGEGPEQKKLVELARDLDLKDKVKFLGTKKHDEVLEYLKTADIFVLNSTNEVMPNIVLESLAVGAPVVAPNVGGIPEIIEDGMDGHLFPLKEDNRVELRRAMEQLLRDDGLKRKLIQNGFVKIGRFDWKTVYGETVKVMDDIRTAD